jgi:tetratricopeptide (TPR) repeat protein
MATEGRGDGDGAEYLDVLLLCAAPLDVRPALNLAVEVANFEAEVRRSPVPIRLRRVFPPTFDQLRRELAPTALKGREPRVFHFLGHGEEDYLWFEDEEGSGDKVTAARLRRVFEDTPIRLALLNACWSATPRVKNLCTHLVEDAGLAAAIGHGKPVADASAIAFARRFYAEVTRGEPVRQAYFAARNALAEKGLPGAAEIDLTGNGDFRLDAGLAPGERTGRVEDSMPTRGYLPGTDFFCGREEEFRAVARALADPATRGFGLWGMGGIGKTALAKEAARRNAWRFRDGGVVFVDAREIAPPTTPDLLRRALARLDPAARGDDPVFELVTRLTAAPGLIVLDNLETLPEIELDPLARFVAQIPANGSHVLLTARAPIRPIEDLPNVPTRLLTTGLHDYDGAFYAHRLAVMKDIALLRDDPLRIEAGEVRGLCARLTRRVSGHPKMIEVAVGIARWGQAELDKALNRLTGDLESKLNEMMVTGLAFVGDEGRRLLAFLPLFPAGNFQPEAMQAACCAAEHGAIALPVPEPDGEIDEDEAGSREAASTWAIEGIRQLERGGFLDRDQQADLFTFHQTLCDYAKRVAPLPSERHDAAFSGLLNFYGDYLHANSGDYQAIDRCLENALIVMETAWTARPDFGHLDVLVASMVDALDNYFERRGLWQLGERWNERAIALRRESGPGHDERALAHALFRQGVLLGNRGQYDEAVRHLRESLELNETAGQLQGRAASLRALAGIERDKGNLAEARRLLQESLGLDEPRGDLQGQAASLHTLAIIEQGRGNLAEARELLRRSLAILERLGDLQGQGASLQVLATIEREQGDPAEARRLLRRSLDISDQLGDLKGQAASEYVLATIEHEQGNPAEARRLLRQSLSVLARLGDLHGQATSLHELASIERVQGNPAEARRLLQCCLGIAEQLDDLYIQSASVHELALIEREQGDSAEARRLLQRSLHISEQLDDLKGQGTSLHELGSIEREQGDPAEARRLHQRSLDISDRLGDLQGQAVSEYELARIEYNQGDLAEAQRRVRRSLDIAERLGDLRGQAASGSLLAAIEYYQDDSSQARRLWERSIDLYGQIGDVDGRASTLCMLAQLEEMEGNHEAALSRARESIRLFEGIGNAGVSMAREVLAKIENSAAQADRQKPRRSWWNWLKWLSGQ